MLISAMLHMGILAIHFLATLDAEPFNFFRIIGLDYFFSEFVNSSIGNYCASVAALVLYGFIYILTPKKQGK